MSEVYRVKIIDCESPEAWYRDLIGHEFDVYIWGLSYVLKEDYDAGDNHPWRHIVISDCEVLK